jgi:hypothetical protein
VSLQFDEATHTYTFGGKRVPSVTEILRPVAADYSSVAPATLEAARNRGVAVDRMIELHEKGTLDYAGVTPEMAAYLEEWERVKAEARIEVVATQERVFNKVMWYAGTLDIRANVGGKPAIIDVKCTASDVPSVGPQTAAYAQGSDLVARYVLYLRPNDDGLIVPDLQQLKNRNDWNVFASCLVIHRFNNK